MYVWYSGLPKPTEITFTVDAPARTCFECDPPGKPHPLVVRFSGSAVALEHAGHAVPPALRLIRLEPGIDGTWQWLDDHTLQFDPAAEWPIGERFAVRFANEGLFASHVRVRERAFEFRTPEFGATLSGTEFHQDPVVASDKKVVISVSFTHPVDAESFEKRVSLLLYERVTRTIEKKRGPVEFTVLYDKRRLNAHVHTRQLAVPAKNGRLAVRVEPGVRAAAGGNDSTSGIHDDVQVPGFYSLAAQDLQLAVARDERAEPRQVLVVTLNHSVGELELPRHVRAWRLPQRHPDTKRQEAHERAAGKDVAFPWSDHNVTKDLLAASSELPLAPVAGDRDHYETHSFRHEAQPGESVYVRVERGVRSFGGYVLEHDAERALRVPDFPRELKLTPQGSLLTLSGARTLTVMARNIPAARVEVGRLLPRQVQHLVSQTSGSFSRPQFQGWNVDVDDLTERFTQTIRLPKLPGGEAHFEALPMERYLAGDAADRRGIFLVRVQAWDPERDRPLVEDYHGDNERSRWNNAAWQELSDVRLVVLTDLGLLAKRSLDGSHDVFVQSIPTGEPASNVLVEVLGRNGLPVISRTTDAQGHVRFPDLGAFVREQEPVLYLARRGGDTSFLPLHGSDRGLDLSRFDVGGLANRLDRGTLAAYVFSDRGLYRPGEEIRVGTIVRSQDWQRSIEGVPLRLDVIDPRGIRVRSESFAPGPAGFGEVRHSTRVSSPTGNYTFSLSVVRDEHRADLIGSTVVQVREFLPDRLRMSLRFSKESADGWVHPDDLAAQVNLQNLFATPAANRRVTGHMTLSPALPSFPAFPGYTFLHPERVRAREGFTEQLVASTTSTAGEATLPLDLKRFAPATYQLHVVVEGFEADGGRAVGAERAQLVSPLVHLVGWKADGELHYVSRGAARKVELLAIDPQARLTAIPDLALVRVERRYVSTLVRRNNGTYQYESRRRDVTVEERALALPANILPLALDTGAPGAFAYLVRDARGATLAEIEYHVAGEANLARTLEKNAELQIALAKPDYAPGEEIEMQIQAPYTGAGLITIERERVHAWRWFRTGTTSSVQQIRVPEGLEGNAYVSVAFVRDPASEEIYASPLSYGVQPFTISVQQRRSVIRVEAPATLKPGETMTLRYSTERPSRIAVFAVDEGILQVARHRTPDPLGHFFQKRSLQVSTLQILDLLMPELKALDRASAPGGDAQALLGRHLNPFQRKADPPVAYWSGILDADSTPRDLKYEVPDYFNGTLRVMAVAVADDAIGVHEGRSVVRGDFVLSPNVPTTVTPGDEFEVSVGVANHLPDSGENARLTIALAVSPSFEVLGDREQVLPVAEGREGVARFRLRTLERLGANHLEFRAASGGATATRAVGISVRPVTPFMTTLTVGTLKDGTRTGRPRRKMYAEHRVLETGISHLPMTMAHGLVTYLGNYPYVCTEQLVSQAMPALVLPDRPEFGSVRARAAETIDGLIDELRVRQNEEGAYRLWPGGNTWAEFVSIYAQHFVLEAHERGRPVPADVLAAGNRYLRRLAIRDGDDLQAERHSAYAIYLLTRQGQVMSAEAARLRKRLEERYPKQWQRDTATAWLAASLQLMQQHREADRLIRSLRVESVASRDIYHDAMTGDALMLYVLSRHFPQRLPDLPPQVIDRMATRIGENRFHSLSAGATLLALDAYVRALEAMKAPRPTIAEVLADRSVRELSLPEGLFPKVAFSENATALRFASESPLNAYYFIDESGYDRTPPAQAMTRGLEVLREYRRLDAPDPDRSAERVQLGEQVEVRLKFRGLSGTYPEVAFVDLLPGGFELVIPPQELTNAFYEAPSSENEAEHGVQAGTEVSAWQCHFCYGNTAMLSYGEPREDRVVFYGTATPEVREVVYRLKATNVGTYRVPPAYGEAMYDRGVFARSALGRIVVERP